MKNSAYFCGTKCGMLQRNGVPHKVWLIGLIMERCMLGLYGNKEKQEVVRLLRNIIELL